MYQKVICFYGQIVFHIIFINSFVQRHLHYFYLLAIVNNAAINICVIFGGGQVFLILLDRYLRAQLLSHR